MYEADLRNGVCGERQAYMTSSGKVNFRHVRDLPLSACDGVFGYRPSAAGDVRAWVNEALEAAREQQRRCNQ